MRKKLLIGAAGAATLTGCVTVETPEQPIDINLNIRIEQEVLVRLDQEVEELITENPDAFPVAPENVPDEPPQ